jgi:hypothetical protein
LPLYPRKRVSNNDMIASIDQIGQKLADCLSLTESPLNTLVHHRPAFGSDLSKAKQENSGDTVTIHQDGLRSKFAD